MEDLKVYCPTCGHLISDCSSVEDIINKMQVIGKIKVNYSDCTNMFYADIPSLEIANDHILCSPTEHRKTPDEAIKAYFKRIISLKWDEYLVIDAWDLRQRKEYVYKNYEFVLR